MIWILRSGRYAAFLERLLGIKWSGLRFRAEGATGIVFSRHLNAVETSQGHEPLEAPDPVSDPPMISL